MSLVKISLALSLLLFTISAGAQNSSKPPATPPSASAPSIIDTLKLKFFKSQSEALAASDAAKQAAQIAQQRQVTFQATVEEMRKVCGEKFTLDLDKGGDPVCVVKPIVKPEPAK